MTPTGEVGRRTGRKISMRWLEGSNDLHGHPIAAPWEPLLLYNGVDGALEMPVRFATSANAAALLQHPDSVLGGIPHHLSTCQELKRRREYPSVLTK